MKCLRLSAVCLLVLLQLVVTSSPVRGAPPVPKTPTFPPQPGQLATAGGEPSMALPGAAALNLPPLKAVLLVGPIDGAGGSWTNREKVNMDLAAAELQANGVSVYKFYPPNHDWEQIKVAARGAHFLFYRGHGVYWTDMPTPEVGGFYLDDYFISPDQIRTELQLAPNAIVMVYGCFAAGSSKLDAGSISSQEAQRRVAQYSDPFLDVQAAGYYSDWYGNAFQMFVRFLFQGMTLGGAYQAYSDFSPASVERYVHPSHTDSAMWLDKDIVGGKIQYDNAFVGKAASRLLDLFPPAESATPNQIAFITSRDAPARTFDITVSGSADTTWRASLSPEQTKWLTLQTPTGHAGQSVTIQVIPGGLPVGLYRANLYVTPSNALGASNPFIIPVSMHIVNRVHRTSIPIVVR